MWQMQYLTPLYAWVGCELWKLHYGGSEALLSSTRKGKTIALAPQTALCACVW